MESVDCFYCNAFIPKNKLSCPSREEGKDDPSRWKLATNKYYNSNNKWCRITVMSNGTIADQVKSFYYEHYF